MKEIAPGVWAETGYRGCNNSCIVTDEGLVLIDPPMCPSHAVAWKEAVSALGEEGGGEVKFLINTEHHGDHAGGNWFFRDALKVSHALTRRDTPEGVGTLDFWWVRMEKMDPEGLPLLEGCEVTLQDVTYDEGMTLRPGAVRSASSASRGTPGDRPSYTSPTPGPSCPATTWSWTGRPCSTRASGGTGWRAWTSSKGWTWRPSFRATEGFATRVPFRPCGRTSSS